MIYSPQSVFLKLGSLLFKHLCLAAEFYVKLGLLISDAVSIAKLAQI